MVLTAEEIRANLIAKHPTISDLTGGGLVTLDPDNPDDLDAYNARIDQWVAAMLETQANEEAEGVKKTQRAQVRTALTQIDAARTKLAVTPADRQAVGQGPAWGTATQAQKIDILRVSADEALQDLAGVIHTLIGRGVVEGEE
jgi:hypothetical protein